MVVINYVIMYEITYHAERSHAMQKRAIAIHDISCVGRCSLTVALPLLSAAGVETAVMPTAILSTHTGDFKGYTFHDLTEEMMPIAAHWETLCRSTDAIYTGYLGSPRQIDIVRHIIETFRTEKTLVMVDPVMADSGKYYSLITPEFAVGMKKLAAIADIITPNISEAALMLDMPYREKHDKEYIETLLHGLGALGPRMVVLSGVCFDDETVGAASYDRETDTIAYYLDRRVDGFFHGTGDVFASALLSALLSEKTVSEAMKLAVSFTHACIERTHREKTETRYGVNFEEEIPTFLRLLGKI